MDLKWFALCSSSQKHNLKKFQVVKEFQPQFVHMEILILNQVCLEDPKHLSAPRFGDASRVNGTQKIYS